MTDQVYTALDVQVLREEVDHLYDENQRLRAEKAIWLDTAKDLGDMVGETRVELAEALAALRGIRQTHQYGHGSAWGSAWATMCDVLKKAGQS